MKRLLAKLLFGIGLVAVVTPAAMGDPVYFSSDPITVNVGDLVVKQDLIGGFMGGGIFLYEIRDSLGESRGTIATFCLERTEINVELTPRPVQSVGDAATYGGWIWDPVLGDVRKALPGESDPLKPESAWLYSQFLLWLKDPNAAFAGLTEVPDFFGEFGDLNRSKWANALQMAIWFYEYEAYDTDETFADGSRKLYARGSNGDYVAEEYWNKLAQDLIALADGKSASGIQVVNPVKLNTTSVSQRQSFPNEIVSTPEPTGLAMLALGLLAVGAIRRRA